MRRAVLLAAFIGAAALLVPGSAVVHAADDDAPVPGEALAAAVGYDQRASQPGATLLGDTLAEGYAPFARAHLQAVGSSAVASVAYPGALVGNSDALVNGAAPTGGAFPSYPAQAKAVFPVSGNVVSDANQQVSSSPGVEVGNMTAQARRRSASAHAAGLDAAAGGPAGQPDAAVFRAQSLVTDATTLVEGGKLVARALSTGRGIALGGGVVRIASYTSRVEATSDGERGAGQAETIVEGMTVNGVAVALGTDGLHAAGTDLTEVERQLLEGDIKNALAGAGIEVRATPHSAGADKAAPNVGFGETGGIVVSVTTPNRVTQTFGFGAASTRSGLNADLADLLAVDTAPAPVLPPLAASSSLGAAGESSAGLSPSVAVPRASATSGEQGLVFGARPITVSQRRGVADRMLIAALAAVMLAGLYLGYARWQLLDWLPTGSGDPGA